MSRGTLRTWRTSLPLCAAAVLLGGAVWGATGFLEESELLAADGDDGDSFGGSVAISSDRMVVGAQIDETNGVNSGSAYVYERSSGEWMETAKLLASDGAEGDFFGLPVALSGDRIAVGASGKGSEKGLGVGAAYIFDLAGGEWKETKLVASDGAAFDLFGQSVALSGDRLVVGAVRNDENGTDSGAVYVFELQGDQWVETAKLLASDGSGGDWFGNSVALSGDRLVVGAPKAAGLLGAAYVFDFDGAKWVETAKLLASKGEFNDNFGGSVALSGDRVVAGAPVGDNDAGVDTGVAFVFQWDGAQWSETRLVPSDGGAIDQFGSSVAAYGDRVVVGAFLHDGGGKDAGAAYVYEWTGEKWVESKLDGEAGERFGTPALSADTLVVGAPNADAKGDSSGLVRVFEIVVLGGTVTGVAFNKAICLNQASGDVVGGFLVGSGWDCLEGGLEVFRGDRVVQWAEGEAVSAEVGGAAFGLDGGRGAARCLNLTTGQSVLIHFEEETSWDCSAAGLEVVPGDQIRLAIRGRAG